MSDVNAQIRVKDSNNNIQTVHPETTISNVLGLQSALDDKVNVISGKGLSTNDYTTSEKNKLSGIETGANNTTIDSSLSTSSTNPVQNKVITSALANKAGTSVATTSANGLMSSSDKSKLNDLTKITWKRYTINLSSASFVKSGGGLYYYRFSVSDTFSTVLSVTIDGWSATPNKGFTPYTENLNAGLMVYDATNPSTLSFSSGTIYLIVLGIPK